MPYNYLVDKKIRENFDIDFKNAVLIIDEAHNIGGVCEEISSLDISESKLENIIREVTNLKHIFENREWNEKNLGKYIPFLKICLLFLITQNDIGDSLTSSLSSCTHIIGI